MRRPTIRLAYALELVATAAVCLGLVRYQLTRAGYRASLAAPGSGLFRVVVGTSLTGLALGGGVGLAVETARGRRPSSWGLGRWIWSISGVAMVFNVGTHLVYLSVNWLATKGRLPPPGVSLGGVAYQATIYQFLSGFDCAIAALCITAMFAGSPRDPSPDGREWAGRVFASLVIALSIAEQLFRASGR